MTLLNMVVVVQGKKNKKHCLKIHQELSFCQHRNLVGSAPTCSAFALQASQVRVLSRSSPVEYIWSVITLLYVCVCVSKTGLRESAGFGSESAGMHCARCLSVCVSDSVPAGSKEN